MMIRHLLVVSLAAALASCATVSSARIQFPNHPVSMQVLNRIIDEDNADHLLRFRNTGTEVISFDYTVADTPNVPHLDASGPNSGYVKNLYPGEEREVPNPWKRMRVFVSIGTMTYGKKADDVLQKIYRPDQAVAAPGAAAGGVSDLFGTPAPAPAAPTLP